MKRISASGAARARPTVSTPYGKWRWRHGPSEERMALHPDFRDLLSAFAQEAVEYLVIGGYAVTFHSRPRFTMDIDLWVAGSSKNSARVHAALSRFGAPPSVL